MDMSLGSRGQSRCRERLRGKWQMSPDAGQAAHLAHSRVVGNGCHIPGPSKLRGAAGQVSAGDGHDGIPAAKKGC